MKKKIYLISTILILIILLVGIHSTCVAREVEGTDGAGGGSSSTSQFTLDKIKGDADSFLSARDGGNKFKEESIDEMIKSIYNILLVLGIMAAVIVGILLSIKFITGGIEEQAQVKQMLIPYVAGCVVIFAAFAIWKLVVDILQSVQDL